MVVEVWLDPSTTCSLSGWFKNHFWGKKFDKKTKKLADGVTHISYLNTLNSGH